MRLWVTIVPSHYRDQRTNQLDDANDVIELREPRSGRAAAGLGAAITSAVSSGIRPGFIVRE